LAGNRREKAGMRYGGHPSPAIELVVDQTGASWNHVTSWLRRVEA